MYECGHEEWVLWSRDAHYMSDDLSLGDREERPARLRSKHAYERYKLAKFKKKKRKKRTIDPILCVDC